MGTVEVDIRTRLRPFLLTVSFEIGDELLALVGPEGGGKSTILRAIAGIYTPDDGTIVCEGDVLFNAVLGRNQPPTERWIGYVPQNIALFPHLTVAENVAFPLRRTSLSGTAEMRRRVDDVLQLLRLSRFRSYRPADIGDAERVWVAIARALVVDPRILLLDEPFAALEQGSRRQARAAFAALRAAIHTPTIVATGELEEACDIGDRVAVLDAGHILQIDTPERLRSRPSDRQVARLLGATNVVPGSVVESVGGWVTAETPIGELHFPGENPWGHELDIVLRPELLRVVAMRGASSRPDVAGTVLPATIVDELRHGAEHVLSVRPDGAREEDVIEVRVSDLHYQQHDLGRHRRCWLILPGEAIHAMPRHAAQAGQ